MPRSYLIQVSCFALSLASAAVLGGCSDCGGHRVEGKVPYVRCLAATPVAVERKVGDVSLHGAGRTLTLTGLTRPASIAAFAGPAPSGVLPAPALAAVAAANPALTLVLGGLGVEAKVLAANLKALSGLPGVVLVLAGGRDGRALHAAVAELPRDARVVDVTSYEQVRIDRDTFVPVSGAFDGRYSVDAEACGHGLSDLKHLATVLGACPDAERRWLLSWHAPGAEGPLGVARAAEGVDAGNADLAELGNRIGARGGIFAWPHVQAGRAVAGGGQRRLAPGELAADLRVVVPRLGGPALSRADGTRQQSALALLALEADGLRWVGIAGEQPPNVL